MQIIVCPGIEANLGTEIGRYRIFMNWAFNCTHRQGWPKEQQLLQGLKCDGSSFFCVLKLASLFPGKGSPTSQFPAWHACRETVTTPVRSATMCSFFWNYLGVCTGSVCFPFSFMPITGKYVHKAFTTVPDNTVILEQEEECCLRDMTFSLRSKLRWTI